MMFAWFSKLFAIVFALFAVSQQTTLAIKKSYVVYLGGHNHGPDVTSADLIRVIDSHTQLLSSFLGSEEKAKDAIFYSYKRHINGFAALLEEEEAKEIAKHPEVISVFLDKGKKLHTTHSWDFLRLERNGAIHSSSAWKKARYGQDTIIANLDSGVWPESKSFNDKGYGPIPSRWKGICRANTSEAFCNRKLIGARYFNKGYASEVGKPLNSSFYTARDLDGHGSHTLSTAAGNFVPGASVFGVGNGTAKGGSPRARVATYKVCWPPYGQCSDADILKAFDTAIHDGVDVVSVSLGTDYADDYFNDGNAIGSFHAVKKGIVVVASAGNGGPWPGSVTNVAPWLITVGASTIDRELQANVHLGNGSVIKGTSISQTFADKSFYPLINGANARSANASREDATFCKEATLDPAMVKGKIVVCVTGQISGIEKGVVAKRAGAAGMILANDEASGNDIDSETHVLPATHISYADGLILMHYINSTKNPKGLITSPKAVFNVKPSPIMAPFTSRGPNTITPQILKPDITAPGVNIIAAYSEAASPSDDALDERTTPFNTMSGTSMSCPHVSGVVGLLKTLHPDWSPAAIKSSIMTTAQTRDNTGNQLRDSNYKNANAFSYGSGHIQPNRAMDPGLVYDLSVNDYLEFLCGIGYNQTSIKKISGSDYQCPGKEYNILNFNYPSISVNGTATVTRKVKNVGQAGTYRAHVRQPFGYSISVEPSVLRFKKTDEVKGFKVSIKARRSTDKDEYKFGQLTWSDGKHYVRSPIVILPSNN